MKKSMSRLVALVLALMFALSASAMAGERMSDPFRVPGAKHRPEQTEAPVQDEQTPAGEQPQAPARPEERPQVSEDKKQVDLQHGGLNLRAAASSESEIVGSLHGGELVTVLGTEGKWTKVRLSDGTEGYVFSSYLAELKMAESKPAEPEAPEEPEIPAEPEQPAGPAEPEATEEPEQSVAPSEPETSEEPEKPEQPAAPAGPEATEEPEQPAAPAEPEVTEEPEQSATPAESEASAEPEQPEVSEDQKQVDLQHGRLNLRAAASSEAEIIGSLHGGELVTVLGTEGKWTKIRLADGTEGYVFSRYLAELELEEPKPAEPELSATPAEPEATEEPEQPAVPTEPEATVEPEQPTVPAEPEATVEPEQSAFPAESEATEEPDQSATPAEPETTEEPEQPATPAEPAASAEPEQPAVPAEPEASEEPELPEVSEDQKQVDLQHGRLNLRAAASSEAEIIGSLHGGELVTVLGTEGKWTKIRLADGTEGYVFSRYLAELKFEEPEQSAPPAEPEATEEPDQPALPVESEATVEPEQPAAPAEPEATVEPEQSATPVEPEATAEPEQSATPAEPEATEEPAQPAAPAEPEASEELVQPAAPTEPEATEKPAQPAASTKPEAADSEDSKPEPKPEPEEHEAPETSAEPEQPTVVAPDDVDVRLDADGMSEIIETIPEGAEIKVLEIKGDWVKVEIDGKIGYIYIDDLPELLPPEPEEQPELDPENLPPVEVTIFSSRRSVMAPGEVVLLSSKIKNLEYYSEYMLQWQVDKGAGFEDVPGATEDEHTFEASVETLSYDWKLLVYYR